MVWNRRMRRRFPSTSFGCSACSLWSTRLLLRQKDYVVLLSFRFIKPSRAAIKKRNAAAPINPYRKWCSPTVRYTTDPCVSNGKIRPLSGRATLLRLASKYSQIKIDENQVHNDAYAMALIAPIVISLGSTVPRRVRARQPPHDNLLSFEGRCSLRQEQRTLRTPNGQLAWPEARVISLLTALKLRTPRRPTLNIPPSRHHFQ